MARAAFHAGAFAKALEIDQSDMAREGLIIMERNCDLLLQLIVIRNGCCWNLQFLWSSVASHTQQQNPNTPWPGGAMTGIL